MPISPNQGPTGGGTVVTITGSNIAGTTGVMFGSKPATSFTQVSPTQVTAVSPSGTGAVGVTLTTPGGTSNPIPFYYVNAPLLTSLSVSSGPVAGGNTITVNGTGLSTATRVAFGTNTAVPTVLSDSQLTVTVPAGSAAGAVAVRVTTAGGTSNSLAYTYVSAPTATTITPTAGPLTAGTP
ncbi:IPT/TIG domain-containing protein, partial [Streptomyces decoyicus]|uniref:IPT/TIG domain-containing protein n=1 Tax=Streptomyces decoyicus TaxID=249567 RepID=UPI0038249E29